VVGGCYSCWYHTLGGVVVLFWCLFVAVVAGLEVVGAVGFVVCGAGISGVKGSCMAGTAPAVVSYTE